MKRMILFFVLMAVALIVQAQVKETPENEEIYRMVEENAEFPGGIEEMYKYLGRNIKYPEKAREAGIEGTVFLEFVVNTDGRISDVRVLRSPHDLLSEEAIRVMEGMPVWEPGKQRGEPVPVYFNLPFRFSLEVEKKEKDKEK